MKVYDIIRTDGDYARLIQLVNEAIQKGYTPVGGPLSMGGDGCEWIGQAVVLKSYVIA